MSILDHFPFPKIREQQSITLREIEANWDKKSIFLLSLPTGTGKSAIAYSIARWAKRAYVLTETKQLQDQYLADFDRMQNLKGKDNYVCERNPTMTAETSLCSTSKTMVKVCRAQTVCPYYEARDAAMQGKIFLTSYSYFLTARDTITKDKREVILCDEGHVLESKLVEEATIELDIPKIEDRLKCTLSFSKFPPAENVEKTIETLETLSNDLRKEQLDVAIQLMKAWEAIMILCKIPIDRSILRGLEENPSYEEMSKKIDEMAGEVDLDIVPNGLANDTRKMASTLKYIGNMLTTLEFILMYRDDPWVLQRPILTTLKITPLTAKRVFGTMMRNKGDKLVIMSATLGDPHVFIEEFGIDPEEVLVIDAESGFPAEKSPIYYYPGPSLTYKNYDSNIKASVSHIDAILDTYNDVKGIIHTGNYRVCHDLVEHSRHSHRMIFKPSDKYISNENLVRKHIESDDNTILVSPSMHSGIDLRDDYSRFQIVAKLCYPNLQDARVKAKQHHTPIWYDNETMTKIVQAVGRSTRHETDYADTFIVDPTFKRIYDKMKSGLGVSFRKRVVW